MSWPKNRPRNEAPAKVRRALSDGRELLNTWQTRGDRPLGSSARELARELGVSDRTVRRWMAGEDNPSPEHHAAILAWVISLRRAAVLRRAEMRRKGLIGD